MPLRGRRAVSKLLPVRSLQFGCLSQHEPLIRQESPRLRIMLLFRMEGVLETIFGSLPVFRWRHD